MAQRGDTAFVKVAGSNVEVDDVFVKQAGTYETVDRGYEKVSGTWEEIYRRDSGILPSHVFPFTWTFTGSSVRTTGDEVSDIHVSTFTAGTLNLLFEPFARFRDGQGTAIAGLTFFRGAVLQHTTSGTPSSSSAPIGLTLRFQGFGTLSFAGQEIVSGNAPIFLDAGNGAIPVPVNSFSVVSNELQLSVVIDAFQLLPVGRYAVVPHNDPGPTLPTDSLSCELRVVFPL